MADILKNLGMPFRLDVMFDNRDAPYDKFIQLVIDAYHQETGDALDHKLFDEMQYPNDILKVSSVEMDEDDNEIYRRHELHSDGGFTLGKLLYELAQVLPEDENIWLCYLYFDENVDSYVIAYDF